MMEYLDWEPGMEEREQEQPDWAKSIGIKWDTDSTNEIITNEILVKVRIKLYSLMN